MTRKYVDNTIILYGQQVIEVGLSLVIAIALARILGAEGFGTYAFAFSFVGFFFLAGGLGLTKVIIRDVAKNPKSATEYVQKIMGFQFLFSLVLAVLCVGISIATSNFQTVAIFVMLAAVVRYTTSITSVIGAYLRATYKGVILSVGDLMERLLILVFGISALYFLEDLLVFFYVLVFASISKLLLYLFSTRKIHHFKPIFDFKFVKSLVPTSIFFLFLTLVAEVNVRVDTIFLGYMQSALVVGWYTAAYKIVEILTILPRTAIIFGFSLFAEMHSAANTNLRIMHTKLSYYLLVISLPASLGLMIYAQDIISLLFGFSSSGPVMSLMILSAGVTFIFLTVLQTSYLTAINAHKKAALSTAISAAINIGLNFILVPTYSYIGAAYATIISYTFLFLFNKVLFAKQMGYTKHILSIWKPIAASGIMVAVLLFDIPVHFLLQIIIGMFVYFAALFICGLDDLDKLAVSNMFSFINRARKRFDFQK